MARKKVKKVAVVREAGGEADVDVDADAEEDVEDAFVCLIK